VLVPAGSQACAASAPATTAAVLGSVAKRIYQEEAAGPYVQLAVHHVQRSAAFRTAVARADPAAVRAEIVRFFQSHIHIVRVRAWRGNQLVNDVGGPFVLAPVTRALRTPGGRVVGRFSLAVQDDVGYAILVHRFTGAQVVMAMGARHVLGPTLPAGLPANGPAVVQGRRYRVVSLTGRAFPSGPLAITLLLPAG
jgi:hypothetical protein